MESVETAFDDAFASVGRRWPVILIIAGGLFLGVLAYAQGLSTTWTASATVAFAPRPDVAVGADTVSLLVPSYVAYVRSPKVESSVGAVYSVTPTELDRAVNASVTPATANLVINVTSGDRTTVAGIANSLADAVVSRATTDRIVSASLAASAVEPVTPSGPRRHLLEFGGLLAALILGALAAVVIERGFPRVRTSSDVHAATGLDVLGRLPRSRSLRRRGVEGGLDPVVGVAVRALRNRLDITNRSRPIKIVAVCSTQRGEGRTTTAVILAEAIARLDARVLVVDADVVRHRASALLAQSGTDADLIAVLEGRMSAHYAVQHTELEGVSVLPTRAHGEVGDLFARRLAVLLEELRATPHRQAVTVPAAGPVGATGGDGGYVETPVPPPMSFDVVVVDTPPLLAADEAGLVARLADAVLFVVDSGSRITRLREGAALLSGNGARVMGVVLNRASRRSVALGGGT